MSAPQVPPRPTRALHSHTSSMAFAEIPRIPPRPGHRMPGRSRSRSRDNFPKSPLNEKPNVGSKGGSIHSSESQYTSDSDFEAPQRPPSVSLPSIGQEGNEYADVEYGKRQEGSIISDTNQNEPISSKNVGNDLPLHAPKPSLSTSTAKARVATVTRTDSSQAAAAGIGKAGTPLTSEILQSPALRSKVSFSRTESVASTERPASAQASDSDHGIPEIGQRVPMYPDAGDVQAPSPAPLPQTTPPGIGFYNDGVQRQGRHHSRTRSGREIFRGPPGSYGMHGHGVLHNDQFEKAWYDKHPDALVREEHGQYGPGISGGRGEWALSSDDLNKIVRDTASRGPGKLPTILHLYNQAYNRNAGVATPNEQIGYLATEEYTSRINTPSSYVTKAHSNYSQTHIESPLRKASVAPEDDPKDTSDESKELYPLTQTESDRPADYESEEDELHLDDEIHIDDPAVRHGSTAATGYNPSTEDLGQNGVSTDAEGGWIEETGYGVPILAADEVAKEPESGYLHPAVSPVQERRGSSYVSAQDSDASPFQLGYRNNSGPNSRASSRPVSVHGGPLPNLTRFTSHDEREETHTPLEDVDEYEPLFPEDQEKQSNQNPPIDKFKRRDIMKRRFPSQDIWEDTPNSLQLQATVDTPESAEEQASKIPHKTIAGSGATTEGTRQAETGRNKIPNSLLKTHLVEETGSPGLKQRFPSRDIWEDSPDSSRLVTTVEAPQDEEFKDSSSEGYQGAASVGGIEKPSLPQKPVKSKLSGDSVALGSQSVPSIPPRPSRKPREPPMAANDRTSGNLPLEKPPAGSTHTSPLESRKAPVLPDRKPQVPARPSRSTAYENPDMASLSKTNSASSIRSNEAGDDKRGIASKPTPKPKPAIPSRPFGGNIASLKAGFLSDLDKRLQLGPQAPKSQEKATTEPEVAVEKAPLADARKGRVRGPPRRKPGTTSVPAAPISIAEVVEEELGITSKPTKWAIQPPWTVWQAAEDGPLKVGHFIISTPSLDKSVKELDDSSKAFQVSKTPIVDEARALESIDPYDFPNSVTKDPSPEPPSVIASAAVRPNQETEPTSLNELASQDSSTREYTPSSSPSLDPTDEPVSSRNTSLSQSGDKREGTTSLSAGIEADEEKEV